MKLLDNKHKIAYRDVFLYTRITSVILSSGFTAEVSTPFVYKDGEKLELYLDNDVISGIGQRNFQRDSLVRNRGKIILVNGETPKHPEKIVGKWDKVKNIVVLYPTDKMLPDEIKVLCLLQKHLTSNNVTVIIELDEKRRYLNEIHRKRGDRVQRRDIRPTVHTQIFGDETDEEDYDYDDN